ncbi:MAG: hypothetical protein ACTSYQ_03610, partial [Candidatus Odinarchaeia archaeon]
MTTRVEDLIVELKADIKQFTQQFDKAGDKIGKFNKKTKKTKKGVTDASSALREMASSVAILQGPLGPIAGRIGALGAALGRVNPLLLIGGLAFAGFTLALRKAISIGIDAEVQLHQLEGQVKATGFAAGLTAKQINIFAVGLGDATLTSAKAVREASGILLTFRSISGETFKETLRLAQDLSQAGFGSLKTNVLSLAKALEDPARGMTALRRQGVIFSETQTEIIKKLVKTNQLFKAQELILEAVAKQTGGAGLAASQKTLAGSLDTMGERMSKFTEQVVENSGALGFLKDVSDSINRGLGSLINNTKSYADMELSTLVDQHMQISTAILLERKAMEGTFFLTKKIHKDNITEFKETQLALRKEIESRRKLRALAAAGPGKVKAQRKIDEDAAAATKAAAANDKFQASLEKQIATLGATNVQMLQYKASLLALGDPQKAVINGLIETIQAFENQKVALSDTTKAMAASRLAELDKSMMSEKELLALGYNEQTVIITDALAAQVTSLTDAKVRMLELEGKYQTDLEAITRKEALGGLDPETVDKRLATLDESLLSELDLLALNYNQRVQIVTDAFTEQELTEGAGKERLLALEAGYQQDKSRIVQQGENTRRLMMASGLGAAANIFNALGALMGKAGEKMNARQKGMARLGIIASTAQAIMNALAVPPYPLGATLAVGAALQGAQQLRAVGGGGGISTPSSVSETATPTIATPTTVGSAGSGAVNLRVNLGDDDDLISKSA